MELAFQKVATLSGLKGGCGLRVVIGDVAIGVYRVGDRLLAMADECPHAGLPLSAGQLEGTRIRCAGHGWEFDLETGLAPGETEEEPLARYPVRVEGEAILVDIEAPL